MRFQLGQGRALVLFSAVALTIGSFVAVSAGPGETKKSHSRRASLKEIAQFLTQDGVHEPYYPVAPNGFTQESVMKGIPENNPLTRAKVELGKQLYFDPRLSADGTVSCASCHHPSKG
ncbi:MAG: cytochrome-c peroxidase, partial [Planctomycetota bacterium]|nr:cytochrome-c peroxidase [Planctomycetota bacterium]